MEWSNVELRSFVVGECQFVPFAFRGQPDFNSIFNFHYINIYSILY